MNTHSVFKPIEGYILVEPIKIEDSNISFGVKDEGKIGKGKVIAIGGEVTTDFGTTIKCPVKVGDIIFFLTYEGGYDSSIIDGVSYVWASFKDCRGIVEESE